MPSLKEKAVNDVLGPQDVASSHFRSAVRASFHRNGLGEIGGPIIWPPRSSDYTPLDFRVWHSKGYCLHSIVTNRTVINWWVDYGCSYTRHARKCVD